MAEVVPVGVGQWQESQTERWARLAVDVRYGLRRGAWYPVLSVGPEETVVVVRHRPVVLPHDCLHIVSTRPTHWSVVARASGAPYAVCPRCADRVALYHVPAQLRCTRCHETFDVEQTEAVGAATGGSGAHARPSRRG